MASVATRVVFNLPTGPSLHCFEGQLTLVNPPSRPIKDIEKIERCFSRCKLDANFFLKDGYGAFSHLSKLTLKEKDHYDDAPSFTQRFSLKLPNKLSALRLVILSDNSVIASKEIYPFGTEQDGKTLYPNGVIKVMPNLDQNPAYPMDVICIMQPCPAVREEMGTETEV